MTQKYTAQQHLTGPALLKGARKFLPLEIPEIETDDGSPSVVFLRHLSTKDVLTFSSTAQGPDQPADPAGQTDEILKLIVKAVCNEMGHPLFTADEVTELQALDMRIFNRLSTAVINMMNGKPLDYVAPKPEAQATPAAKVEGAPLGNVLPGPGRIVPVIPAPTEGPTEIAVEPTPASPSTPPSDSPTASA